MPKRGLRRRHFRGGLQAHTPTWQCIGIEADGRQDSGVCPCCGSVSRVVWGHARLNDEDIARYHVHWTVGAVAKHGANFDLVLGPWEDGTTEADRRAVSLAYRLFESGPSVMVIDAQDRYARGRPLFGRPMSRQQVIGTPLATLSFAILDAIYLKDIRVRELAPP